MAKSSFVLVSLLPLLISASNDWSTPCLDGWCSYDVPASDNTMAATIEISGSPYAISDITTAAGWEVLNCTADSDAQDIRIVCTGNEASCSHLFENGAAHTIIRLPQECASIPFAHVTSCAESDDQSLPENVKSRVMRRDGTIPPVHTLSFNANFSQVPAAQHGNVSMLVYGSTIPGFTGNATITPAGSRRRSRLVNKRSLIDSLLGGFDKNTSTDLPPINIDQSFNIFNTTLSCSASEQAKLSVDVNAKVDAQVTIGAVLAGSLIPPNIKEFGLYSDVSADLEGGLSIDANISGQFDTGKIPLFSVGLPGLSIAGILSIGPTFEIDAQALATIDLDVSMDVDLAYSFSDLQLFFPPSASHASNAVVAPKDTPLKLSASPNVESNATLEAHLIPMLKFGLSVFGTDADIFLDLDTFAALDLGLVAGASASVDSTGATGVSAQVGGCVDVNGGVSVNAGADAAFFGLFNAGTQVALFSKNFDFFKKCFEESTSATSSAAVAAMSTSTVLSASESVSSESGRGLSAPATVPTSESAVQSSVSFDPSASGSSFNPSASIVSSISFVPSISAVPSNSVGTSSSNAPSGPVGPSASVGPSSTVMPTSLSAPTAPGSSGTSSVASTSIVDTRDADPTSAPASTHTTNAPAATRSSTSSSKGTSSRRRGLMSAVKMAKRAFQCLAPGVAAAESVVDQTLASSSFT